MAERHLGWSDHPFVLPHSDCPDFLHPETARPALQLDFPDVWRLHPGVRHGGLDRDLEHLARVVFALRDY
jgi:hypothetical protein